MHSLWVIAVPAFVFLLISTGAIFLPKGAVPRRWPFVVIACLNLATLLLVMITQIGDIPAAWIKPPDSDAAQIPESAGSSYWVNANRAEKHTCPSSACGVVGYITFREPVAVFSVDGDWVRISEARRALCVNGHMRRIRTGDDRCGPFNGVQRGSYYEWIQARYLSTKLPSSGSAERDEFEALVSASDDFRTHRDLFADAAKALTSSGTCTREELKAQGGFRRATAAGSFGTYFAYCGGDTIRDRVYVDPTRKDTFR